MKGPTVPLRNEAGAAVSSRSAPVDLVQGFVLPTLASDYGIGAVLKQVLDVGRHVRVGDPPNGCPHS